MAKIWLLLACAATASASAVYSITDLGGLGAHPLLDTPSTIRGQLRVGRKSRPAAASVPFQSRMAACKCYPSRSATETYAYGVKGSGTVVRTSFVNGQAQGTIWAGGRDRFGSGVYAMAITDSGQVVGSNGHAFVTRNGVYQDLGIRPGGNWSAEYAISASETVVRHGSTAAGTFRA